MEKQEKFDGEVEIDLMQIMRLLVSKLWIIILAALILGTVAIIGTKAFITPLYQSYTRSYIVNRQNSTTTTVNDINASTQLVKDYKVLVTSLPVVDQVISDLGIDMTSDELISKINCKIETDSRVLTVTVTDEDPYLAKQLVDAIADVSAKRITSVMKIEGVEVIQYGRVPSAPSSPNTTKNAAIGAILGAVAAMAVIIIRFLLDDTIKNSDDVEKYLGTSTLALIPITEEEYNGMKKSKKIGLFGKRG